jgi:hypothetical protein
MAALSRLAALDRPRLLLMAALFGVFTIGMTAVALSYSPTAAQHRAERECAKQGLGTHSAAWELCLAHVTRAFEWEERSLAQQLARASGEAEMNCLDRRLAPQSADFRSCLSREIDARSQLEVLGEDNSGANVAVEPGGRPTAQQ